jgi:hypothetical protein
VVKLALKSGQMMVVMVSSLYDPKDGQVLCYMSSIWYIEIFHNWWLKMVYWCSKVVYCGQILPSATIRFSIIESGQFGPKSVQI